MVASRKRAAPSIFAARNSLPASHLSFSRSFSTIQSSSSLVRRNTVDKLRVLIGRERIAAKVAEMGQRISQDFRGWTS
jgi:hypothetical protein